MSIEIYNDIDASVAAFDRQFTENPGMIKLSEDLARYQFVLISKPELLIETGTYLGGSAAWFAQRVPKVVTIDTYPPTAHYRTGGIEAVGSQSSVTYLEGNSTDPEIVAQVAQLAHGKRTMVVLDSDHSAKHVATEIKAYGPFVSPGYHLVVEDTIVRWLETNYEGSPLDAVESELVGNPDWARDRAIDQMHPISMYPAGWWMRLQGGK